MKKLIQTFILTFGAIYLFAQPTFPDPGPLYADDVVPRIDIMIHPDSLALIFEYPESDHEFPANFIFDNGSIRDTVLEVGFRLRGNTSRQSKKKSYKVSFNTFHSGRKYYGVEKLNLNGEHNDPSVARSKLNWDYLEDFKLIGSRSNHVKLYINGSYYGLYLNVEHIDEEFVLSRFMNNNGNLYKCTWPADLRFLGTNPDYYKLENNGRRVYELKINESEDDYSDLAHFIDVLNNTTIANLPCELEKVFNVYDYLKVMAMDVTTGNWDGYIYNKNNYYLYHNTASNQFEYIPYDLDNTYGIDWFNVDWEDRNMYSWSHPNENRPLYERILLVDKYRDQYSFYTQRLLEEIMEQNLIFSGINALRDKLYPYILSDPFYPLDYGYTAEDFLLSYDQPIGDHDVTGLKPFITNRRSASLGQLQINNIYPILNYEWHSPTVVGQEIWFRVYMEDDEDGVAVSLLLSVDGGAVNEIQMFDDGMHNDFGAGDGFYGCSAGTFYEPAQISVNIKASDIQGLGSIYFCEPKVFEVAEPPMPILLINEFMADNASIIADEGGEFDDWIEIYNKGAEPVWLGDLYMSDKLDNPGKWKMPDYTLAPDAFLIIWADDDLDQGSFHASFKLSKDGEAIGIFGSPDLGSNVIDSIIFGQQDEDISTGLIINGGSEWKFFENPTPGYSNESGAAIWEQKDLPPLKIYPNPCSTGIIHLESNENIRIYDLSGRLQLQIEHVKRIDLAGLEVGVYLIISESHKTERLIIM